MGQKQDLRAELIWKEFEYRHDLFWRSLFRWGTVFVLISIVPWVRPELERELGEYVLVFPAIAAIIAVGASWHLAGEYYRLVPIIGALRDLRRELGIEFEWVEFPRYARGSIGETAYRMFFALTLATSCINAFLLWAVSSEPVVAMVRSRA